MKKILILSLVITLLSGIFIYLNMRGLINIKGLIGSNKVKVLVKSEIKKPNGKIIPVSKVTFIASCKVKEKKIKEYKEYEFIFTTDKKGEAIIEVEPGTWYLSGSWKTKAFWIDVPFKIDEKTKEIKLNNSNAKTFFD